MTQPQTTEQSAAERGAINGRERLLRVLELYLLNK